MMGPMRLKAWEDLAKMVFEELDPELNEIIAFHV
jgi:hypothetical protein